MNVLVTITDGDSYKEAWVDARDAARILKMMERCGITVRALNGRGEMVRVTS